VDFVALFCAIQDRDWEGRLIVEPTATQSYAMLHQAVLDLWASARSGSQPVGRA
jgi:hypothetical protein